MKTKTVNLYAFDELSDKAKEKARDWFRELLYQNENDWENVFEDARMCGESMGIHIDENMRKWVNAKTGKTGTSTSDAIYFSGFSSQGDGACFDGTYRYVESAEKAMRDWAPLDKELHRIAAALDAIQAQNGNSLTATMKQRGHYLHSGCMTVDVERTDGEDMTKDAEEAVTQLMRDFADWIYGMLEKDYEYQQSDEHIDECLTTKAYTFLETGKRED